MPRPDLPRAASLVLAVFSVLGPAWAQTDAPSPFSRQANPAPEKEVRGWPLLERERYPDGLVETDVFFSAWRWGDGPRRRYRYLFPLYWSHTDHVRQSSWSLFLPLYYRDRRPEAWRFWSAALATGEDEAGQRWVFAPGILPLYRRNAGAARTSESLGLPWLLDIEARTHERDGRTDLRVLNLFPWGEPGRSGLPLFVHGQDPANESHRSGLFPLYHLSADRPDGHLLLWPVGYWHSWSSNDAHHVLVPLLSWMTHGRRNDSYAWHALLSLWSGGRETARRWLRIEPFFSTRRTETGGYFSILRTYGQGWDEETGARSHHVFEPLGLFESGPDSYRQRFFPFYFAGGTGDGSRYLHLAPFLFSGERSDDASYLVFVPLYFQHLGDQTTTRLLPLYFERSGPDDGLRIALPLFGQGWSPGRSTVVVFPVYTGIRRPGGSLDLVLGPLYVHRRDAGADGIRSDSVLWPLVEYRRAGDDRHFRALPVAWFDRSGDDRLDVVAPLYVYAAGKSWRHLWVLPAYGSYRTRHGEREESTWRVFAAGAIIHGSTARQGEDGAVSQSLHVLGPLAGLSRDRDRESSHSRLLPFWWRDRSPDRELTVLLPFYVRSARGPEPRRDTLTLLGGNAWVDRQSGDHRERGVLWPLSRYRTGPGTAKLDLLGLFARHVEPGRRSLRLSPFYHERDGESRATDVLARFLHLVSRQTSRRESRLSVMPFLYGASRREGPSESSSWYAVLGLAGASESPRGWHRRLLPFYYHEGTRSTEAPDGELESETLLLFPFYYDMSSEQGDRETRSVLFPLVSRTTVESEDSSEWHILWPLLRQASSREGTSGHLFPLYGYRSRPNGELDWRVSLLARSRTLAPGAEARGTLSTHGYLSFSLFHRTAGRRSLTWTVNPFLLGYHANEALQTRSWNTLLGAAGYRRSGPESRWHALFLAAGESTGEGSSWRVSPLVHSLRLEDGRLPGFVPARAFHLYSRAADPGESRWAVLGVLANGSRATHGETSEFRILHRLVCFLRRGTYRERAVEPFFTWEDDTESGQRYFSLLKFVYIESRPAHDEPLRRRLFLIPLGS